MSADSLRPSPPKLRTDTFLDEHNEELRLSLAAIDDVLGAWSEGRRESHKLAACRRALEALAGSSSFVGQVDIERIAAKAASVCDADSDSLDVVLRETREALARALETAGSSMMVSGPATAGVSVALGWDVPELSRFGELVRATFADAAFALERAELFPWLAFVRRTCCEPVESLVPPGSATRCDARGAPVFRPQVYPLASWIARMLSAVERGTPAGGEEAKLEIDSTSAAVCVRLCAHGVTAVPLPSDPGALKRFGAISRVRRMGGQRTIVELFVPSAMPLCGAWMFENADGVYAIDVSHDLGENGGPKRAKSTNGATMLLKAESDEPKATNEEATKVRVHDAHGDVALVDVERTIGRTLAVTRALGWFGRGLGGVSGVLVYRDRPVPLLRIVS